MCPAGYYCPVGSTSGFQNVCGSAGVYCPAGSAAPTTSPSGYFTSGGGSTARSAIEPCSEGHWCTDGVQHLCPAGRYGASTGLASANCSGVCRAGFVCEPGSTSPEPVACGSAAVYCPAGATSPVVVQAGFYSIGGSDDGSARTMELACPLGSYCVDGVRYPCAAGRFGDVKGNADPDCSGQCLYVTRLLRKGAPQ